MSIEDILRRSEVFLGLDDTELKLIASLPSSKEMNVKTGQILFKAGSKADNIFILEEGQINLIVEIPEPENKVSQITVEIINKGGLLGWSAILRPHTYVLTAISQQPSRVMVINGKELLSLFEQNHAIAYRVLLGLSQVISSKYRNLEHILIKGKRWPFIEDYIIL